MLFVNTTPFDVILIIITSIVGLFGVASGIEGYNFKVMPVWQRIVSIVGGLLLIYPGIVTDIIGIVLVGGVLLLNRFTVKNAKKAKA